MAVVVVVADQLSKAWALSALASGHVVPLLSRFLQLRLVHNPGAAFSLGERLTWVITTAAVVVCIALLVLARRGLSGWWWAVTIGCLLGGAVGNLIDRLIRPPAIGRGHVVDFIDYNGFFVGNIADIAIVGAAAVLIVLSQRDVPMHPPAPAQEG
ncbi:MAG: signal peptidase II [Micrococcales bacterium]|nr:MAG: signal peptidase II [Micrococcales bacterium]PIE27334.1 MAG: signal peptidase II [Micrococcales bacterium]